MNSLRLVKLTHTIAWAFFASCVLAIPVMAWRRELGWAVAFIGIVSVEVVILAMNSWHCPLTPVAARYTENRRPNFDIYLPEWLARWNKEIFGTLFVAGILFTIARWSRILLVGIVALGALTISAEAQQPDFSGRWISEAPPPIPPAREASMQPGAAIRQPDFGAAWGRDITIRQDNRAVTIEWQPFTAYDLQPPLIFVYPLDGAESVNTIVMGRGAQTQRSRASWDGRSLVVTTIHADDTKVRQTLTLESPTTLVVETVRTSANGTPVTSRTVYTRKDP